MIRYLLDTDVLSASAPAARPSTGVVNWLSEHTDRLAISTVSVAEIVSGVAKLRREGASRRASDLTAWVDRVLRLYGSRILPLDVESGKLTGDYLDRARGAGLAPGFADMAIAASAQRHGLTLATRNARHFQHLGIAVFDPFLPPPSGPSS